MQLILIALDLLVINVSFITLSYFFRKQSLITAYTEYNNFFYFFNICWIFIAFICNVYAEINIRSFETFARRSMNAFVYFMGIVMLYLFFSHLLVISRVFLVVLLSNVSLFLLINRFVYLFIYQYFRKKEYLLNRIIILGYNPIAKKLVEYLEKGVINAEIIGFCEEDENIHENTHYPVLNSIDQTLSTCKMYNATDIYSTIAPEQNRQVYDLIRKADQNFIRFKLIPDLGIFIKQKLYIDYIQDLPVITTRREPLQDLSNRIRKRASDVTISLLVIIFFLSFLVPLIGLLIKLGSKGPIFFKQLRSARNNKSFYLIKFRSMYVNDKSDYEQASQGDERITPLGRFLRRSSLDEFPQFINVLKGQMSIVGPRPHMLKHTSDYSALLNKYMIRQFVKPGITGWAQVNGLRGETKMLSQMEQRVEHDIWYMENWSLWLDVRIIFMTILNIFRNTGSVG